MTGLLDNQLNVRSFFIATLTGTLSNVTGNGETYDIPFNASEKNIGGDFTTSATPGSAFYTAPIAGSYGIGLNFSLGGLRTSHTSV